MRRSGRKSVRLECAECFNRNYTVNKRADADRGTLVLRKHCPHCNKHTEHREAK